MPLSLKVEDVDITRRRKRIRYKATPAGVYAAGGDVIDFTAATNPKNLAGAFLPRFPKKHEVSVEDDLNGCAPKFVEGTLLTNAKMKIFTTSDAEHAAGAYSANELADTFLFDVIMPVGGGAS